MVRTKKNRKKSGKSFKIVKHMFKYAVFLGFAAASRRDKARKRWENEGTEGKIRCARLGFLEKRTELKEKEENGEGSRSNL